MFYGIKETKKRKLLEKYQNYHKDVIIITLCIASYSRASKNRNSLTNPNGFTFANGTKVATVLSKQTITATCVPDF